MDKIKRAEDRLSALHRRMDEDAALAHLESYTLEDEAGNPVPNAISVTMNEPAVFANAIVAMIQESTWQTSVYGDVSDEQAYKIERAIDVLLDEADNRLLRAGRGRMFPFFANHSCLRGWMGARVLALRTKSAIVPDILPIDMRYFYYERSPEGLLWGAYKTMRTPEQIYAEYGLDYTEEQEVVDYWDEAKEEVWINDEMVKSQQHPFGEVPFVIQATPAGFMLWDDGYSNAEGESIFMLNRDTYKELNRLVSIDQTLAMKAVMPPYQITAKDGEEKVVPYPDKIGTVTVTGEGEEYKMIQRPDINTASQVAHQNIAGSIQRGGVNNIDLGNISFPTSAVWISEQTEIRNKLVAPRLSALGIFYEQIVDMLVRQFTTSGVGQFVSRGGRNFKFKASDLMNPDDYRISMKLMSNSKKQEIANITIASAARGLVSRETLIKNVLEIDDPAGEMARLQSEDAEQLAPEIKLVRMACELCDMADMTKGADADKYLLESMMLTDAAVTMIKQRRQQEQVAQLPKQNQSPAPLTLNPKKNEPKKGADNGRYHGRPDGGRPPSSRGVSDAEVL
jgi:hypothetical protein